MQILAALICLWRNAWFDHQDINLYIDVLNNMTNSRKQIKMLSKKAKKQKETRKKKRKKSNFHLQNAVP